MELLPPKAPIGMEDHQRGALRFHKAGGHQGHQLQKTLEVGEAAQCKRQRGQQLLVAALLLPQAVEQLAQRSDGGCRLQGAHSTGMRMMGRRQGAHLRAR